MCKDINWEACAFGQLLRNGNCSFLNYVNANWSFCLLCECELLLLYLLCECHCHPELVTFAGECEQLLNLQVSATVFQSWCWFLSSRHLYCWFLCATWHSVVLLNIQCAVLKRVLSVIHVLLCSFYTAWSKLCSVVLLCYENSIQCGPCAVLKRVLNPVFVPYIFLFN